LDRVDQQLAAVDSWLLAERNQIDGIAPSSAGRNSLDVSMGEVLDRLPAPDQHPAPWWHSPGHDGGVGL